MPGSLVVDHPTPDVARITVVNPSKRGALDRAILDRLPHTLAGLEHRCVIVTGTGSDFSAGYDLTGGGQRASANSAERFIAHPRSKALAALEAHPYPVVAALTGPAIGGGLELAVACDMRVAHDRVQLGMPPAKLGLVYSHTGIQRFIDVIGPARTRELFFVGRRIDAATADRWGLVNAVVPTDELERKSIALASEIAANAPLSLAGNKRIIRALTRGRSALEPDTLLELEALRTGSLRSRDFQEGVAAFVEKRTPRWRGC